MPKIIENLREDILSSALQIIDEQGMDGLSIRALAGSLEIAPSTIYNYFENKEQIIGALMKFRWEGTLRQIDIICSESNYADGSENARGAGDSEVCDSRAELLSRLGEIVRLLRTEIRPLLIYHITAISRQHENIRRVQLGKAVFDVERTIINPLETRVEMMLKGSAAEKSSAAVLARLLITCMYDINLEIEDIVTVAKSL